MNYLYREYDISNAVDHVLLVGQHVVTHHHSTLKIYDLSLQFIRVKYFYEKILALAKIDENTIVILFDQGKCIQCDLEFNPLCLRMVDSMEQIGIYNNMCILYNKYELNYFNVNADNIAKASFGRLRLNNVKHVFFVENYIPTVIVVTEGIKKIQCTMLSLEGEPFIIEEFELIESVIAVKSIDKYVIFASRNHLQIIYRRELHVIRLNRNLELTQLIESVNGHVVETITDGSYEADQIFLEKPHILHRDDILFVLNTNGELYTIVLKCDFKKIISASISYTGKLVKPSTVDFNRTHVMIGSWHQDSVLYTFMDIAKEHNKESITEQTNKVFNKESITEQSNKVFNKENTNEQSSKISDSKPIFITNKLIGYADDVALFSNTPDKSTNLDQESIIFKCHETVELHKSKKIESIGMITNFSLFKNNAILITTTKGLYVGKDTIELEIIQKNKINFKINGIFEKNASLFVSSFTGLFKLNSESLELSSCVDVDHTENAQYFMNLKIFKNTDNSLVCSKGKESPVVFENVDCWSVGSGKLAFVSRNTLEIYDLPGFERVFKKSCICNFETVLFNESVNISNKLKQISKESYGKTEENEENDNFVTELLIVSTTHTFILIRTVKQLYIYQVLYGKLIKLLIPKLVLFYSTPVALFNLNGIVYCRAKQPCFIFFSDGISVIPCNLKISYPMAIDNTLIAYCKGNLIKCKINHKDITVTEKLILTKIHTFANDLYSRKANVIREIHTNKEKVEQSNTKQPGDVLEEDYRDDFVVKFTLERKGCFVLVKAGFVAFQYVPFIPTVHISDPQTGKTSTEPINKDEAEYINPYPELKARTLCYFIELFSHELKLMSSIELEPNEMVCDIKFVFGDLLVVCSSFPEGEDKMARGKLAVYQLTDIVADPEKPHITKKLKFMSAETFKDACLSVSEIRSLIAICVGTRLLVYEFNVNTGLNVVGINEVSLLSTGLFVTKNFFAMSDIYNGVFFFFLRPKDPLKIHLLGKSLPVHDCRFITGMDFVSSSDECMLSLVALDKQGTIHIFTFSPNQIGFKNANLLVKRAEIVTKTRYPLRFTTIGRVNDKETVSFSGNVMVLLSCVQISKILVLQHFISMFIEDTAGLNVRNYLETIEYTNSECKAVISEKVLLEFFFLRPAKQNLICKMLDEDYLAVTKMIESSLMKNRLERNEIKFNE